jgi:hypothetical protein
MRPGGKDLKSVYYALSLARRLHAGVYILRLGIGKSSENRPSNEMEEALADLIASAREAGLTIALYLSDGEPREDILSMVSAESIDLMVYDADDTAFHRLAPEVKRLISGPVIEVKEKNHISYL